MRWAIWIAFDLNGTLLDPAAMFDGRKPHGVRAAAACAVAGDPQCRLRRTSRRRRAGAREQTVRHGRSEARCAAGSWRPQTAVDADHASAGAEELPQAGGTVRAIRAHACDRARRHRLRVLGPERTPAAP